MAELRGERLVIAPVELDSAQAQALREELAEVVYESLKRTLRVRLPEDEIGAPSRGAPGRRGARSAVSRALAEAA